MAHAESFSSINPSITTAMYTNKKRIIKNANAGFENELYPEKTTEISEKTGDKSENK